MGICTDIMHKFVKQEISRIYSSFDGWKMTQRKNGNSYETIFVITRMNQGTREIVKLLVSFKKVITLDMLEELTYPEKVTDGMTPRRSYALMVPANADISAIPKDLTVMTMTSFAFEGKELIWVNKPARKTKKVVQNSSATPSGKKLIPVDPVTETGVSDPVHLNKKNPRIASIEISKSPGLP
jgi:hypothetical protein